MPSHFRYIFTFNQEGARSPGWQGAERKMAEHSEGQQAGGAAPVFVDNSGGRRRTWRRLGLAMGMAGGGYALVVAVSVIGGSSDAPWGVLIPGSGDGGSGAVRVVPEREEDAREQAPGASAGTAAPEASASAPSAPAGADRPRTQGSPDKEQPADGPATAAEGKTSATRGKAASGTSGGSAGSGGTSGGQGGSAPTPDSPPAEAGAGGAAGSADGGTPDEPGDGQGGQEPSEPPSGGGLLEDILGPVLGGGASATGAE
ncbi:hypothetical protein GCM10012287_53630 [Streptomyces daqingensis]|uniref:Translation initiation factor IF-2 n=2 Tax=Streptomyces daqingensis TaxID=1472640 RepID=A0ABQ2MX04_9ACTN|nr:hypothetical protein GCM10012287_53630 [Streptomyces daqingensis]